MGANYRNAGAPLMLTVGTVAVGMPAGGKTGRAEVVVVGGPIRWGAAAGFTPTATVGNYAPHESVISLGDRIQTREFRAIRDASATADATLSIQPYAG